VREINVYVPIMRVCGSRGAYFLFLFSFLFFSHLVDTVRLELRLVIVFYSMNLNDVQSFLVY
jgi:hypothetical protein